MLVTRTGVANPGKFRRKFINKTVTAGSYFRGYWLLTVWVSECCRYQYVQVLTYHM